MWADIANHHVSRAAMAMLIAILGLWAAGRLSRAIERVLSSRVGPQSVMLASRLTRWVLSGLVLVAALHQLGFDMTVLLGAAGVLTVALGFASQTSASNLISGLFLMAERPFVPGDAIRVGTTVGVVQAVDLMSVKLRTYDNLFVRIPNENLLKSEIANLTRNPIRRVDIALRPGLDADIDALTGLLVGVCDQNPLALDEPRPVVMLKGLTEGAITMQLSVWTARENFIPLRTAVVTDVVKTLQQHGIPMAAAPIRILNSES
ncbi:MAG: small-conductance mechanosensitive channel [Myxococcota bacterium]|jgi:small-conductance mechanosensitive channel